MQTTEDLSARLRADLSAFIGTENWHRHPINRSMLLTDGVVYFADKAGAWWFLDLIATEVMRFHPLKPFLVIDLDVREGEADIHFTDGDGLRLYRRHIHFTDAPSGLWRFYLTDNVMLLPGGILIMDEIIDFAFDLDIEISVPFELGNPRDIDPLCHPRFDLFQDFRMTGLGAMMDVTLPVSTACVDKLDCYVNQRRDCVTLEHLGLSGNGDRQISLRLFQYREGAYLETGSFSWLSSEHEFAQVTEIIRASVVAGEAPLWNLLRAMELPIEFVEALSLGIGGDVACPGLMKDQLEVAILIGYCSVDAYLSAMGCSASSWEPIRRHTQRILLRAQQFASGAQ